MDARDAYEVALTETVWVRVLHNETSMFYPFSEGDQLRFTVGFPAKPDQPTSVGDLLGWVYEQLNVDDPDQFFAFTYRQARNRSLSVGDVVELKDHSAWACEGVGWREVTLTQDQQRMDEAAVVVQNPEDGIGYVVNAVDKYGEETFPESQ